MMDTASDVEVKIAPMTAVDYDGYVRLMEVINRFHYEALPDVFLLAPVPFLTNHEYNQLLEKGDRRLIGAYLGDELCGFVQTRRLDVAPNPVFRTDPTTHVDELVVDPGYRRRGIARRLLAAAEAWAKEQGSSYVSLTVLEFNESARRVYEACGYGTRSRSMRKRL